MNALDLARKLMEASEAGDEQGMRAVLAEDGGVWHNFDQVTQSVDQNMSALQWMKKVAPSRTFDISRLEEIEGGYLQEHILRMENRSGEKLEVPGCLVVSVVDGRITLIREYLDPVPFGKLK